MDLSGEAQTPFSSWSQWSRAGNDWMKTPTAQQAALASDQSVVLQPLTHHLWALRLLSVFALSVGDTMIQRRQ